MKLAMFKNPFTYITEEGVIHNVSLNVYASKDLYNLRLLCLQRNYIVLEHDGFLDKPETWNVLVNMPNKITPALENLLGNLLKQKKVFQSFMVNSYPYDISYKHFTKSPSTEYYLPNYTTLRCLTEEEIDTFKKANVFFIKDNTLVYHPFVCSELLNCLSDIYEKDYMGFEDWVDYFMDNEGCVILNNAYKGNESQVFLGGKINLATRIYLNYLLQQNRLGKAFIKNEDDTYLLEERDLERLNLSTEEGSVLTLRPKKLL